MKQSVFGGGFSFGQGSANASPSDKQIPKAENDSNSFKTDSDLDKKSEK